MPLLSRMWSFLSSCRGGDAPLFVGAVGDVGGEADVVELAGAVSGVVQDGVGANGVCLSPS